jgi:hypothetical protein
MYLHETTRAEALLSRVEKAEPSAAGEQALWWRYTGPRLKMNEPWSKERSPRIALATARAFPASN